MYPYIKLFVALRVPSPRQLAVVFGSPYGGNALPRGRSQLSGYPLSGIMSVSVWLHPPNGYTHTRESGAFAVQRSRSGDVRSWL